MFVRSVIDSLEANTPGIPGPLETFRRRAAPALVLLVLLTGGVPAPCAIGLSESLASPADLQAELGRFRGSSDASSLEVSLAFRPIDGPDTTAVILWQDDRLLIPASVTKLVTTVATLEELGPRHTLRTRILASRPLSPDGRLEGDLIVEGGGDPFLVSERLWLLANQIRQTGLREIAGDLIVDATLFDTDGAAVGDILGNSHRAYSAAPSAFAVNFNALALHIRASDTPGELAVVRPDPISFDYLEIDNQVTTGPPGRRRRGSVEIVAASPTRAGALERLIFRGSVPAGSGGFVQYRKAEHPLAFSASLFRAFLRDEGIQIAGTTRFERVPETALPVLDFESEPLEQLLSRMNRHSSNFIANQLAMNLAAEQAAKREFETFPNRRNGAAPQGIEEVATLDSVRAVTLRDGGAALTQWLRETFPESGSAHLDEGSGLSTGNRLSAGILTDLLLYGWKRLDLLPSLISSLPEPGEDGTMDTRFRGPERPVLHAKTGTLAATGVSCLAGFVEHPRWGPTAFAILLNTRGSKTWTIDRLQQLQERWVLAYLR